MVIKVHYISLGTYVQFLYAVFVQCSARQNSHCLDVRTYLHIKHLSSRQCTYVRTYVKEEEEGSQL